VLDFARDIARDLLSRAKVEKWKKIGIDEIRTAIDQRSHAYDPDVLEHAVCRFVVEFASRW